MSKHYGFRFLLDAELFMDGSGLEFKEVELSKDNFFIENVFESTDGTTVMVSRNYNRDWETMT
jgi:hypothetical protein